MTVLHHVSQAIASLPYEHEAGEPGDHDRREMARVREMLRAVAQKLRRLEK